jgi:phage baseplate assembly protein W
MVIYSDINLDDPETTPLVEDLDAIKQSIEMILTAFDGTRLFRPEYDSGIEDLLFEPMDDLSKFNFRSQLSYAIETFEPRVTIEQLDIFEYPDQRRIDVDLVYAVKGFKDQEFELSRGFTL